MKKVAVTGGLASGKTAVCRILEKYGAYVISADEIVHQLLSSHPSISRQLTRELGPDIVVNGEIDRAEVAKIVFFHPEKLQALEKVLHPAVLEEIENRYRQIKDSPQYPLFVAEVPLLYESDSEKFFDAVITVLADPEICQKRYMQKTGHPLEEYERRMRRQIPPDQKADRANFTIINNGTLEDLKSSIQSLFQKLVSI